MFHLFENEEEKKARLQKNEDTKGFFKKAFGGFFDFEFSESKLKQALLEFDEKLLIQGLEAGKINPNRLVFNKMPIFMEAVKRDMFDFARQLVEKKADVNQPDSEGNTAVMVVVDTWWTAQNRKFWPLLKKAGADFDKPNNKGQTPLMVLIEKEAKAFSFGVNQSDLFSYVEDQAAYLIKFGADVNFQNHKGQTVLHEAISQQSFAGVKFLMKKGADVNLTDKNGNTPLMLAASMGLFKIAECLITQKTDFLLKNNEGQDAYQIAMKNGHIKIAKIIKEAIKEKMNDSRKVAQRKVAQQVNKNVGFCQNGLERE